MVVLSDMEKGLERALTDVLPKALHGLCLFHIEKNFVKKFKSNMNGVLWKAAKCTTPEEFRECINELESVNPAAANYIRLIDPKKWARSHFQGRRFGHLSPISPSRPIRGLKRRDGSIQLTFSRASSAN